MSHTNSKLNFKLHRDPSKNEFKSGNLEQKLRILDKVQFMTLSDRGVSQFSLTESETLDTTAR